MLLTDDIEDAGFVPPQSTPVKDFIYAPFTYSTIWYWIAAIVVIVLFAVIAGVVILTLPYQTLKKNRLTRSLAMTLMKRRYFQRLDSVYAAWLAGTVELRNAYLMFDKYMRDYVRKETGLPVHNYDALSIRETPIGANKNFLTLTYQGLYTVGSDQEVLQTLNKIKEVIQGWE